MQAPSLYQAPPGAARGGYLYDATSGGGALARPRYNPGSPQTQGPAGGLWAPAPAPSPPTAAAAALEEEDDSDLISMLMGR